MALRDFVALGHDVVAFTPIQVGGKTIGEVATELAQFPENITVACTLGRYHLVVCALAIDLAHFLELVDRFTNVSGIQSVRWDIGADMMVFRSQFAALSTKDLPIEPRGFTDRVDDFDLQIIDVLA